MTVMTSSISSASPFLRREAAARYVRERHGLPLEPRTLAKYACLGGGPMFCKAGRTPLYRDDWLDAWVSERLSKPIRSSSEIETKLRQTGSGPAREV